MTLIFNFLCHDCFPHRMDKTIFNVENKLKIHLKAIKDITITRPLMWVCSIHPVTSGMSIVSFRKKLKVRIYHCK